MSKYIDRGHAYYDAPSMLLSNKQVTIIVSGEVMEWISVKDKLPEPVLDSVGNELGTIVIVCDNGLVDVAIYYKNTLWDKQNYWIVAATSCSDYGSDELLNVTHWMPLPEAPNGDM